MNNINLNIVNQNKICVLYDPAISPNLISNTKKNFLEKLKMIISI